MTTALDTVLAYHQRSKHQCQAIDYVNGRLLYTIDEELSAAIQAQGQRA
jgi:hypothetical protein